MKKAKEKLSRKSWTQQYVEGNPVHEEFCKAHNQYSAAVQIARTTHWMEWLKGLDSSSVWTAGQTMKGTGSDGGRTRVPDLRRIGADGVVEVAVTNERKSKILVEEFYPGRGEGATDVPEDTEYPDAIIRRCRRRTYTTAYGK